MSKTPRLPIASRRSVSNLGAFAAGAPASVASMPPHAMVRAIRNALHMTQAQLAKRASLPQSHLARIEAGRGNPRLSTLQKLFRALGGEVLVVPRMAKTIEEALLERAREKARRSVARVSGTMALEKQLPDDETLRALIRAEEARLMSRPTSELWQD